MNRNLLLISNSILFGSGYLDHCENDIKLFLGDINNVLFIPFARPGGISHDEYSGFARTRFEKMGYALTGIHEYDEPAKAVMETSSVFIGGGNTFVLLRGLYEHGLIEPIRERAGDGMPFIGTSAGSNVAGHSIGTTNDMPITYPPSFNAFQLLPLNINPHYLDPDPGSRHMGETRATRIKEFHVFNEIPVVGLREGAMLHVQGETIILKGTHGARLFRKDREPAEYETGDTLSFLME